jgi:hypothetical protein
MKKSIFALAFALIGTQKSKAAAESAGLYCHVERNGKEASCWFCNCGRLSESLQ